MLWVTRSHVHVDRVACPWLISRFIDSDAEFLFVPKSQVEKVAADTGAIPFDAPGVELGHHDNKCSFETLIDKYELADGALLRLAKIVHAADIAADLQSEEIAPGLEAIAKLFDLFRCPLVGAKVTHEAEKTGQSIGVTVGDGELDNSLQHAGNIAYG